MNTGSHEDFDLRLRFQCAHERLGLRLAILAAQEFIDVGLGFFERYHARRLLIGDLDDVVAERRFDELTRITRLERERGLLERRHHLPLLEVSEVAAVGCAAWILRVLFRGRREVFSSLEFLQNRLGFCLRLQLGGGVGILRNRNQDVTRLDTSALLKLVLGLLVEVSDRFGLDRSGVRPACRTRARYWL